MRKTGVTLFESFMANLNESSKYKVGDTVYWVGAGNEISATGVIKDFPTEGRMTILWDDGDVNTYDIDHPDIQHENDYDNSINECDKSKSVDLKEIFKKSRHKRTNESVQSLATVIWGDVTADEEHMGEDYEIFSILSSNIDELEDEYNDGNISKKEFFNKIKINCVECQLNDEETKAVLDFYEKSYSDSPEDMSSEESFVMYNEDTDKEVKVWKQEGKWHDDEGNRYMGYLSKQEVKSYFRGNWHEVE